MQPKYEDHDPIGWGGSKCRGAALGRGTVDMLPREYAGKFTLQRVRLNGGGYDRLGTYWGHAEPLFWCGAYDPEAGEFDACFRATDRAQAKRWVRYQFPNARFYR